MDFQWQSSTATQQFDDEHMQTGIDEFVSRSAFSTEQSCGMSPGTVAKCLVINLSTRELFLCSSTAHRNQSSTVRDSTVRKIASSRVSQDLRIPNHPEVTTTRERITASWLDCIRLF